MTQDVVDRRAVAVSQEVDGWVSFLGLSLLILRISVQIAAGLIVTPILNKWQLSHAHDRRNQCFYGRPME